MIVELNRAVALVEEHLAEDPARRVDAAALAARIGTTEHHLRRMFGSLAGMPLSDYVRRRRMSLAARDLTTGRADLLTVAVRHGYGSAEAFGRAFRAVHGASPAEVRRDGGPLRTQPAISFALAVHGGEPMHTRIVDLPDLRLIGHARRVRLVHEGVNPEIAELVASVPVEETGRLKELNDVEPRGVLAVSDDLDPDREEGTELTYLHGVASTAEADDLDVVTAPAGTWAVFTVDGPYPAALQDTWARTATEWFASQPWRLRPGPEVVAVQAMDPADGSARGELWLPVEPT